jgi:hypothetical protein
MNTKKTNNKSQLLNISLIIAVLLLIALMLHGNSFHKKKQLASQQAVAQKIVTPAKTNSPKPMQSPLEGVKHPLIEDVSSQHETKSILENKKEFKKALTRQSQDLRDEAMSESMRPSKKRSLTLSEEEIIELEKNGKMIN